MVVTARHMVEHVFPAVVVRQWVVVFPKRLRYFMNHDAGCLNRVAGIALSEVQRATAGASTSPAAVGRTGGVLFVLRFGATLNAHVHLHLCMLDGVVAQGRQGLAFRGAQVDEACVQRVQAAVRQRVLGLFERPGLLSRETVVGMQGWGHSGGFSVHAGERLLRYCARPMFAGERLVWAGGGAQVRYRLPWAALQRHRPGLQGVIELRLSASEFLDRVAELIPPPREHRQRYFGVLAPNSPWRAQVTAQAGRKLVAGSKAPRPKTVRADCGTPRLGHPARYLWAQLLARIYGVFVRKSSGCGGRVRLIGFITEPATVRQILEHVGEPASAPAIAPARSPPVAVNGQQLTAPEAVEAIPELEFDQTANLAAEAGHDRLVADAGADAEPIPDLEFDQTLGW